MIRRLDRYWFRLLAAAHGWLVRRGRAHHWRQVRRRFRRQLEWQRTDLN
jgi:hypothetical protein